MRRAWLIVAILAAASGRPAAHELSQSLSRLTVEGSDVRAVVTIDGLELQALDVNGDERITFEELERVIEPLYADFTRNFRVHAADPPQRTTLARYTVVDDHVVELELLYRFAAPVARLTVESTLDNITRPTHRHLTSVGGLQNGRQAILGGASPSATFEDERRSVLATAWDFVRLGIEHIVTGYDHLAFLVGLVIASASLLSLAKVITFFTLGHSLTLALATFDLVTLPTRLIESVIALSVAYVAFECLRRPRVSSPYLATFGFGLVHGFGFSNVLREMALPPGLKALSLFSFNTGVELGQLVFVIGVFPLIAYARSTTLPMRQAISVGLIVVALYWFAERALM